MFLRFVTFNIHPESEVAEGVFHAAYRLLREEAPSHYWWERLRELLDWFEKNLPIPYRFSRSRRAHKSRGVCWLKPSARECLDQMREMALILDDNGVCIRVLKTSRPGYVVYEDDFQVVAEPFSGRR